MLFGHHNRQPIAAFMQGGTIISVRDVEDLFQRLRALYYQPASRRGLSPRASRFFSTHLGLKATALGLAALVWVVPFLITQGTVRIVTVPVEFRNVPTGMQISQQSATTIEVQLRASAWLLETMRFSMLVARFTLEGTQDGSYTLVVDPSALNVPPGVTVERMFPRTLSIRLARRPG
jgi:hypothetical protein